MITNELNKTPKLEKPHLEIIKFDCYDIITTSDPSSSQSGESGIDLPIDKF